MSDRGSGSRPVVVCSVGLVAVLVVALAGCGGGGADGQVESAPVELEPGAFALAGCDDEFDARRWNDPSAREIGFPEFNSLVGLGAEDTDEWVRVTAEEPLPVVDTGASANPHIEESARPEGFPDLHVLESDDQDVLRERRYLGVPGEYDLARQGHDAGGSVWIGLEESPVDDDAELRFVVETAEGQVVPIGNCMAARALLEVDDAPAVFGQLVEGEVDAALAALQSAWASAPGDDDDPPRPSWDEQDPADRSVGDAPPEVQASLRSAYVVVAVPEAWQIEGWLLCPRLVGLGLGTCLDLANPGLEVDPEGLTTFSTPVSGEVPLELVLRQEGGATEVVLTSAPGAQALEGLRLEIAEPAARTAPTDLDSTTATQSVTVTGPYVPGGGATDPVPGAAPPTTR